MTNIVERLRDVALPFGTFTREGATMLEAADEIVKLRTEIERLKKYETGCYDDGGRRPDWMPTKSRSQHQW
jgi:hypothetical protein